MIKRDKKWFKMGDEGIDYFHILVMLVVVFMALGFMYDKIIIILRYLYFN